jgi:hypothetical protein
MENDNGNVDDDDVEQDGFRVEVDLGAVLDQYLSIEELSTLILKERGMFFIMICCEGPHKLMSLLIFNIKH